MKARPAPARPTRLFIALGLALLITTPAVIIGGHQILPKSSAEAELSKFEATLEERITRSLQGVQLPRAFSSSPEFAPFGAAIKAKVQSGDAARGMLLTNLGHEDWDAAKSSLLAVSRTPCAPTRARSRRPSAARCAPG